MRKSIVLLLTVGICLYWLTGITFGQTITLTPTPKTVQPTTNPTTAIIQGPTPAKQITATPTPLEKIVEPTKVPVQIKQTTEPTPTEAPTSVPVTPTPTPKPFVLISNTKPPFQPIAQIITAPFNLVMNSFPQNYYNDQGLAPATNTLLLSVAGLSLLSGTVLLAWPSLMRFKKNFFVPSIPQKKSYQYIAGRV